MAEHFCQNFLPKLEVHHINLNRADNVPENLMCLTKKEHIELHKALKQQAQKLKADI